MKYIKFENFINSTQYGYTAETTSPISGDAKYLRITDIVPYFVEKDRVPYCAIDASKVNKYIVHDGDVLIARTGATTGYNLVVDDSFKNYVFASYLIRFNYDRKRLHPRYLKYVLKSPSWYGFVNNYIGGSAQPGMNARVFGKYYLPYTDFSTQQKIASILSAYDSLIENNQKRIKLLEQMAENLYKEWFVRFRFPGHETAEFEGGVPKGWKIKRIGEICDTIGGGTPSTTNSDFWGGTIKWVTPTDITSNKSLPLIDVKEKITELGLKKSSAKMLPPHTILMTSRASIGFFGICEEEVCTNQGFISIIPGEDNLRMYMLHNLMMRKDEIVANANGSTFLEISKGRFRKMHMLIPTHELLCSFQKQAQKCFDTVLVLEKQIRLLTTQRDLLLPRLMSGKLSI